MEKMKEYSIMEIENGLRKLCVKLGLTIKIKYLKDDEEPSAMGIVADNYRKMPDVITGEGIFRFSAFNRF
jgi:hypothetical protein